MAEFARDGRWLLQQHVGGRWMSVFTGYQFVHRHEAQDEADRCNAIIERAGTTTGKFRVKEATVARHSIGRTKKCGHPYCLEQVPDTQWACGLHWRILPENIRRAINRGYDIRVRTGNPEHHHDALHKAERFWARMM